MATISPTLDISNTGVSVITWTPMANGDTIIASDAMPRDGAALASVQFDGTFGGGTATLKGSNDGVTFFAITDRLGNAIAATSDAIFEITTTALFLKPDLSGGSAGSVQAVIVARG